MHALWLIPRDEFEAVAGPKPVLGTVYWFDRPKRLPKDFERAFMVTVRPDHALWLVQDIGANTWTVDLTPVLHLLRVTAGIAPKDLATALATPRALSEHDFMLIRHACNEGMTKRKPFVVKLPKWLLEDAAKADAAAVAKAAPRKLPARPKRKRGQPRIAILEHVLSQIEEASDEIRTKPGPFLAAPKKGKRGKLTEDVQSVFAGVLEPPAARRALAPFATARALAAAKTDDAIDEIAIAAIDMLCRGLVAAALDRPKDVPPGSKKMLADLAGEIAYVRKLVAR